MTDLVIPFALKDTMPPRRLASSQNSQVNDDIPPLLEALPLMSTEGLYRYLGTLVSLVERQARAIGNNGQGQSSSTRGSSFDDFKKLGPLTFLVLQIQQRQRLGL